MPRYRAVDNVSFEVGQGEFVALVGPSGSGKTTLLAMLAALLRTSAGNITIDGQDLGSMSDDQRAAFRRQKIGFTFQANNLVSFLTALENVELMLRLNGRLDREGKARSREPLERLGLGDRLNSLPRQLSGGQQQRVAIARALIHQPSVVLADEPTASLDTERAFQVVETFSKIIREQGRARRYGHARPAHVPVRGSGVTDVRRQAGQGDHGSRRNRCPRSRRLP